MYDEGKCPLNNVKGENRQQNHTVYTCASFSLQKNSEGERARRALFEWLSFSNMAMGSIILLLMQTLRENLCQPPHGRLILRPPHLLPVPLWRSGHSLGPQHLCTGGSTLQPRARGYGLCQIWGWGGREGFQAYLIPHPTVPLSIQSSTPHVPYCPGGRFLRVKGTPRAILTKFLLRPSTVQ